MNPTNDQPSYVLRLVVREVGENSLRVRFVNIGLDTASILCSNVYVSTFHLLFVEKLIINRGGLLQ